MVVNSPEATRNLSDSAKECLTMDKLNGVVVSATLKVNVGTARDPISRMLFGTVFQSTVCQPCGRIVVAISNRHQLLPRRDSLIAVHRGSWPSQ